MDSDTEEIMKHLFRMYIELSDKYRYVSNKLKILEQMVEVKKEIAQPQPEPKDEVVQEKKEVESKARRLRLKKIREQFDLATGPSGPVPDQSE